MEYYCGSDDVISSVPASVQQNVDISLQQMDSTLSDNCLVYSNTDTLVQESENSTAARELISPGNDKEKLDSSCTIHPPNTKVYDRS